MLRRAMWLPCCQRQLRALCCAAMMRRCSFLLMLAPCFVACGSDDAGDGGGGNVAPIEGTSVRFDLSADVDQPADFYAYPFPSDLRLDADGRPSYAGFDSAGNGIVEPVRQLAEDRTKWAAVQSGYFQFDAPPADPNVLDAIPAEASSPVLLVDIGPDSPERGKLYPTIATSPEPDQYTPENLLGVAPHPGVVLPPNGMYAYVVRRSLGDAEGAPLGVPVELVALSSGKTPPGERGAETKALYEPLWPVLDTLGVDRADVAAATVFSTGDTVAETHELTERVLEKYDVDVTDLKLDTDGDTHERFCEFVARVRFPHFQKGVPPFDTEGHFEIGSDGAPIEQRGEISPIVITLPKTEMPAGGYPMVVYFHGSGGISSQVVERGKINPDGTQNLGEGPAHVMAAHGFAALGSAHPLSPERIDEASGTPILPDASAIEYLNFSNLSAFRDTFRQGVIEQRLLFEAISRLEIDPSELGSCTGPTLPAGASKFKLSVEPIFAMGQSMGGMYTNMVGAVEPKIGAVVPTGAGGLWSKMITETDLFPDASTLVGIALLGTRAELTQLHPTLALLETSWEAAEPIVYVPRLAQRPLEGHPVRPIYEPVGEGDEYFSTLIFDAFAMAYGNEQAGDEVWPTMQPALSLVGRDGIASYAVKQNRTSVGGEPYTGAVVQYASDYTNGHYIFAQLDEVKHQYGCFFETFRDTGVAVVPAPAPLGSACTQ